MSELIVVKMKEDVEKLTRPTEEWNFAAPPRDPSLFAQELVSQVWNHQGLGIAANQLGYPWRVFALRGDPQNICCFNPRIVMLSTEQILLDEGCLSFPGLLIKIKRPRHVRVRFEMANGETVTHQYTGMTARCFLHEMDHMEGRLFFAGCSELKVDRAIKKAQKIGFDYSDLGLARFLK
jgi:peptide deformylase